MKVSYGSFYSGIKFEDADRAVVNYKIWFGFGEWSRSQEIPEGWSIVGLRCETQRTNYLINLAFIISPDSDPTIEKEIPFPDMALYPTEKEYGVNPFGQLLKIRYKQTYGIN